MTSSGQHSPEQDEQQTMAALAMTHHTATVVHALQAADVPHLLLKGATTAAWLYPDDHARPSLDTDLLVPADREPEAITVLEQLGYASSEEGFRPHERTRHATAWRRQTHLGRHSVDLHRTLAMAGTLPTQVWQVLRRDAAPFAVGRATTNAPGRPAQCLVLALHAAQHGRALAKPLEDLRRARSAGSAEDWNAASRLAAELDCLPAFNIGLRLVESGDVADTADPQLGLRAAGSPYGTLTIGEALSRSGRDRVRFVVGKLAPSPAYLRASLPTGPDTPLPTAYARRLLQLAKAAPTALRLAARAHRRTDR